MLDQELPQSSRVTMDVVHIDNDSQIEDCSPDDVPVGFASPPGIKLSESGHSIGECHPKSRLTGRQAD